MAQGPSGRIVLEVDPVLKRDLYSRLAAEGLSLKQWFIRRAGQYITEHDQPTLPGISDIQRQGEVWLAAETSVPYSAPKAER